MWIERIIVRKLRALDARDDSFLDSDGIHHASVCLRGENGSGKTTYLETIASLWSWFRRCTKKRQYVAPAPGTLSDASFAAMKLCGLPGPFSQMWVAWGTASDLLTILPAGPDNPYRIADGVTTWSPQLLDFWDTAFAQAENPLGEYHPPPNIVFIEAEQKYVPKLRADELTNPYPTPAFAPVPRYLPEARGGSHLEGMMRTLYLARRDRWEALERSVRLLRPRLRLLERFDESTQRPIFQLSTGELLFADRLSAGERSLLINLCMVLRWLAPGGMVLLDEPELHLHVSLMRGSLSLIEDLVKSPPFQGQLVVASHAPEAWDHFRHAKSIIDLDA